MPFLLFGKQKDDLVFIGDVKSGKTNLVCPYCSGDLIAKKGKITSHHFAHTKESCLESKQSDIYKQLPLFDFFRLGITSNTQVIVLRNLIDEVGKNCKNWSFYAPHEKYGEVWFFKDRQSYKEFGQRIYSLRKKYLHLFIELGFLERVTNKYATYDNVNFKVSEKGKAFALLFTLKAFYTWTNQVFEQIKDDNTGIVQAMQNRLQNHSLYFIKVDATNSEGITDAFYKIGITSRSYDVRIAEIRTFLLKHYKTVNISKRYYLDKVAIVEGYFKAKFAKYQFKIGRATEYFKFPKTALKAVNQELNQVALITDFHKRRIKQGIKNAPNIGKRGKGKVPFLEKPKSKEIIKHLKTGASLRDIRKATGYSINTIRKVKDHLNSG